MKEAIRQFDESLSLKSSKSELLLFKEEMSKTYIPITNWEKLEE